MRRGLALLLLCLGLSSSARGDEAAFPWIALERELWRERVPLADGDDAPDAPDERGWGISDRNLDYPRIRFEAYLRVTGPIRSRVKHGRERFAGTFETRQDAHLPGTPTLGVRYVLDARISERISFGLHYSRLTVDGPTRAVHYRGIGLQTTRFPGHSRVRTSVDVQVGEAFVRFVIKDTARIRFSIGGGATWASHRVVLSRRDLRADGRAETFFVPSIGTWFSIKVIPIVSFFFESLNGLVAPWRPASFVSEFRTGLRWHLTDRVELVTGVATSKGQLQDEEDLWGGQRHSRHLWRVASWSAVGGELGLAVTF